MLLGGLLGVAATGPFYRFTFSLVAATAYALVVLVAYAAVRIPSARHLLLRVGFLGAFVGGMSSVGIIWFQSHPSVVGDLAILFGSLGIVAMSTSMIGARLGRLSDLRRTVTDFTDRNQLGAFLICAGGTLGLIGSPGAIFFFFAFLPLISFVVVLFLGLALFGRGPERGSRVLALVALYFAVAGSVPFFVFLLPALFLAWWGPPWFLFIGPTATAITAVGAVLRSLRPKVPQPAAA